MNAVIHDMEAEVVLSDTMARPASPKPTEPCAASIA